MHNTPPILDIDASNPTLARITLNRPSHHNRLHASDLQTLLAHFAQIQATPSIRVLLLTSHVQTTKPVFCAGYHLGQFEETTVNHDQSAHDPVSQFEAVADALEALRPITIAALNGSVYGGATDLALACDFCVGVHGMQLRMPAAALGLHYYPSGLRRYIARLGLAQAKMAFLSAHVFDDAALLRNGFLHQLVPPEALDGTVSQMVAQINALAPMAVQGMKQSINEILHGTAQTHTLRQRQINSQASADFAEAQAAFAEKRAARFKGE